MPSGYAFAIDRGGTFTDVYFRKPNGSSGTLKLLSDDPCNYRDAPTEAIRRILQQETGITFAQNSAIPTDKISWIRMGTTVATNALLERKGERIALLITKGFKDLLFIGNQSRPCIFDLDIKMPDLLYEEVHEIDERIVLVDNSCELSFDEAYRNKTVTGDEIIVEKELDSQAVESLLKEIRGRGIRSLAVALLHSFKYPNHEIRIGDIAKKIGFANISLSSAVMPMIKIVSRGFTACADAYLTPIIQNYISSFKLGFANALEGVNLQFMQSDGGLCPVERFCGSRAILSGPAAGVVGVSLTAYNSSAEQPIIGFDMGGTSTDVCRYAGEFEHVMETTTAGVTIQAPQLDIHTIAAGGGSRLFFRNGMFVVGPESSGANPGPVCYRKNGFLSLTDADVVLGRIVPAYFPHIFGATGKEPIDKDAAVDEMIQLVNEANDFYSEHSDNSRKPLSVQEAALGFIEVANEAMCRAIRSITQAKGHDTSKHVLACFGGAGGQHACAVAKMLDIKTVKISRYAGVLSAYGLALADTVFEAQEPVGKVFNKESIVYMKDRLELLKEKCRNSLKKSGFTDEQIRFESFLHMRYEKTDCALMCSPLSPFANSEIESCEEAFKVSHKREFGFVLSDRQIIVDNLRVRGIGLSSCAEEITQTEIAKDEPVMESFVNCVFKEGSLVKQLRTPVYDLQKLKYGHCFNGPALITDPNCTIVVEPSCEVKISCGGDVEITVKTQEKIEIEKRIDPIQLSIFSHRFMSVAEQMGRILQRIAISTNIKERLDFSCALFDCNGGLVANAPHIPVHLGGMQATVKYQLENLSITDMSEGDVILCNHPKAGGSHLPDLTVITPVYYNHSKKPIFFVANRGHHADIGGLVPGSMPPHSTSLEQEGATFVSFKLVEKGIFREKELIERLEAPGKVPGCSGTRNLTDNLADLKAQIAANQKGANLVQELIDSYGLDVVQAYMEHIQNNAELAVRKLLKEVAEKENLGKGTAKLHAVDFMDDGTPISLNIEIDRKTGDAIFDFVGTGPEVYSSCNAPSAVTMAAVIYCLRCLVASDIPLNQGCLVPVKIKVPQGTILSPHETAAVVGGNVVTSQRICDVIFRAFNAVAASQGCMNNVSFGDELMGGYYETVAGGAGAGPGFDGRSAVHTHMTNTKITDPEILESRYPVILREFAVRYNSGGAGKYHGGNGCIRKIQFRRPLKLSVLSERRAFAPYGLAGGEDGSRGLNLLRRRDGRVLNLGSKNSVHVSVGDIFELQTPGGGGYGLAENPVL